MTEQLTVCTETYPLWAIVSVPMITMLLGGAMGYLIHYRSVAISRPSKSKRKSCYRCP